MNLSQIFELFDENNISAKARGKRSEEILKIQYCRILNYSYLTTKRGIVYWYPFPIDSSNPCVMIEFNFLGNIRRALE